MGCAEFNGALGLVIAPLEGLEKSIDIVFKPLIQFLFMAVLSD